MYSVDHIGILDHMSCTEPGNLIHDYNIMLKYKHFPKVVLNLKADITVVTTKSDSDM